MRVVFPDPEQMTLAGYPSLAYCPFLMSSDGSYPDEGNRYLRERALCEWRPYFGHDESAKRSITFQTEKSCEAMAKRLMEFLLWCECAKRDWRKVDYVDDLHGTWQRGMLDGTASRTGKKLSPDTVNPRVNEACYFLVWAAERGLRSKFQVPVNRRAVRTTAGNHSHSSKPKKIESRVGVLPARESKLLLPSPQVVGTWVRRLRARYPVKSLMCELIIDTGIRISECNQWRVDTLPSRSQWRTVDGQVAVEIRHGVKGGKVHAGSTEGTRPREVLVSLDLADRMDRYREFVRPNQLRLWVRAGATKPERDRRAREKVPEQLWLSESSYRPFDNVQLYRAWTQIPGCPKDWHPHAGREYFAVESLVAHTRMLLATQRHPSLPALDWLYGVMAGQVKILLSPLMGHVSEETTRIYLKAVRSRLAEEIGHPALRWQDFCERDQD